MSTCWCGNTDFIPFGPVYGECSLCGTLVSLASLAPEQLQVHNDELDFYGKEYWFSHQTSDLGLPDIYVRARNDLAERNLYWLKALLKFCLPPAKVLELGCAHGSFVYALRQAGYDASGVEMSPWIVDFGRKIFDVPLVVGPIENINLPTGSIDVIVLMDVLEHLPNPTATMAYCLNLLKPDGLLLIQTPKFKTCMDFKALVEVKDPFLDLLTADEHLYLFSESSITHLFHKIGVEHIQFEPAIFGHYDMFLVVSKVPTRTHSQNEIESALLATPHGRIVLALLDVRTRELELTGKLAESEADRGARFKQIIELNSLLKKSEADRVERLEQLKVIDFFKCKIRRLKRTLTMRLQQFWGRANNKER